MVSIKEVADAAGVSTATVSRVLSDKPHVRPDVRQRVLDAVDKLNYRPNLVARSLRSQQSSTIGLIVSDIRNPFFTAVSRAVEDTAYQQGYSVFLCNTDENPAKEALYLKVLQDENVAGIIFSPTRQSAENFSSLKIQMPTVVVDRTVPDADLDTVLIDNIASAYRLTDHLIQNGYTRIGAIFGEASTTGRQRRIGFEEALQAHSISPDPDLIRYVQPKIEAGCAAVTEMLTSIRPPQAVFTSNSLLTAGALLAIREQGLSIPDDVALVGFDETTWSSLVDPGITLIAQPTADIGTTAAELLLERIADPERPTRTVTLKGQLMVRGSSAPQRVRQD
jgi:LacI family fructose operon transcriptional repressor